MPDPENLTLEGLPDAALLIGSDGRVIAANDVAREVLGLKGSGRGAVLTEVLGENELTEWLARDEGPDRLRVRVPASWSSSGLFDVSARRLPTGAICLLRTVEDRRAGTPGFPQDLVQRDALTGLMERAEFERRFTQMTESGQRGALLLVDVEGFSEVNETYGQPMGDQILISVAEELKRSVRRSDPVARIGGDEFAVLLHGADRAAAKRVAANIATVLERIRMAGNPIAVTIGYALSGQGENRSGELDSLLAEATRQRYVTS